MVCVLQSILEQFISNFKNFYHLFCKDKKSSDESYNQESHHFAYSIENINAASIFE